MEPTVIVKNANGPVLMNRSDYNADEHGEIFASLEDALNGTPQQTPMTAIPPQGYASRSTPEEIAAAIGNATPPAPVQMAVTKKGRKFIVVDTAGNVIERDGIDKDGYASDTEAWAAITALSIPQA